MCCRATPGAPRAAPAATRDAAAYPLDLVWGKSRGLPDGQTYPLVCHLVDSAATATALWDGYVSAATRGWLADQVAAGDPDLARAWLATAAGLHDIGKATPAFTTQDARAAARIDPGLATWEGATVRHDESGYWSLLDLLSARGWSWTEDVDPVATPAHRLAEVVGGHHGTYPPLVSPRDVPARMCHPAVGGPAWAATRAAVLDAVLAVTAPGSAWGAAPGNGPAPWRRCPRKPRSSSPAWSPSRTGSPPRNAPSAPTSPPGSTSPPAGWPPTSPGPATSPTPRPARPG